MSDPLPAGLHCAGSPPYPSPNWPGRCPYHIATPIHAHPHTLSPHLSTPPHSGGRRPQARVHRVVQPPRQQRRLQPVSAADLPLQGVNKCGGGVGTLFGCLMVSNTERQPLSLLLVEYARKVLPRHIPPAGRGQVALTGIGERMFGCSAVHLQGGRVGCTRLIGSTHLPGIGGMFGCL